MRRRCEYQEYSSPPPITTAPCTLRTSPDRSRTLRSLRIDCCEIPKCCARAPTRIVPSWRSIARISDCLAALSRLDMRHPAADRSRKIGFDNASMAPSRPRTSTTYQFATADARITVHSRVPEAGMESESSTLPSAISRSVVHSTAGGRSGHLFAGTQLLSGDGS